MTTNEQQSTQKGTTTQNGGQQQADSGLSSLGLTQQDVLRMMFPDQYGEPSRESVYEDGVFAGTVDAGEGDRDIGVFSIFVFKADARHPKAEMAVKTNGTVLTDPRRLKKVGQAMIDWAEDEELAEALEEAKASEEQAASEAVAQQMMRGS